MDRRLFGDAVGDALQVVVEPAQLFLGEWIQAGRSEVIVSERGATDDVVLELPGCMIERVRPRSDQHALVTAGELRPSVLDQPVEVDEG